MELHCCCLHGRHLLHLHHHSRCSLHHQLHAHGVVAHEPTRTSTNHSCHLLGHLLLLHLHLLLLHLLLLRWGWSAKPGRGGRQRRTKTRRRRLGWRRGGSKSCPAVTPLNRESRVSTWLSVRRHALLPQPRKRKPAARAQRPNSRAASAQAAAD